MHLCVCAHTCVYTNIHSALVPKKLLESDYVVNFEDFFIFNFFYLSKKPIFFFLNFYHLYLLFISSFEYRYWFSRQRDNEPFCFCLSTFVFEKIVSLIYFQLPIFHLTGQLQESHGSCLQIWNQKHLTSFIFVYTREKLLA